MNETLAYCLNGTYLVVWGLLLVHCLRKPRFFPVFGPGRGTRIFWLATFACFNPVLSFLYLLFGGFASADARATRLRTLGTVTLVAVTVVVFHFPFPAGDSEVRVVGAGAPESAAAKTDRPAIWFRLGRLITNTRTRTTLAQWSPDGATFSTRAIAIFCADDDPLLAQIARTAQDQLAETPEVETVTWYPAGRFPEAGRALPDIVITLALPEKAERRLPLAQLLDARVHWLAAAADMGPGSGFGSGPVTQPCTAQFRLEGDLEVNGCSDLALTTASARYLGPGTQLGGEVAQSIAAGFEAMAKAHGVTPTLPAALRGPYRAPPDPASLGLAGAEVLLSGPVLLEHTRTIWRLRDDRDDRASGEVFTDLRTTLEAAGWKASATCSDDSLHLHRGNRELRVHRPEHGDALIARFDEHLEAGAITAGLDEVLAAETPLAGLMMFRSRYTPAQRERLRKRLETERTDDALAWFRLAQAWKAIDEKEKAAHALKAAVVYGQCGDVWADAGRVSALARELGDENLPATRPSAEVCGECGFLPVEANAAPAEREVGLDEPIFFTRTKNGPGFFTLMVKIRPQEDGTPQFRCKVTEQLEADSWGGQTNTMDRSDAPCQLQVGDGEITIRTEEIGDGRYKVRASLETASTE